MNALAFKLLRRLADGEFHSGAALAHALRVSRGTIWNGVRAIEAAGVAIYKVRGRGYRIAQPLSLLDRDAIENEMGGAASRFTLEIVDEVASTNTLLLERAAAGAPSGSVVAAEWQTHGRGRRGRAWHAGPAGALTFSIVWRFSQGAAGLSGLSLAAGVALVRALGALDVPQVSLKWPNDLVWRGRKLAGILIEMQGDALGPSAVVIGIGLNVRLSPDVAEAIDQPAVDLETVCDGPVDRNRVLATLLRELAQVLEAFSAEGFAPLREEWQRHHAHQDRVIDVELAAGKVTRGIARGVAEDGALLVETGDRLERLHSGEVSVRATAPEPAAA